MSRQPFTTLIGFKWVTGGRCQSLTVVKRNWLTVSCCNTQPSSLVYIDVKSWAGVEWTSMGVSHRRQRVRCGSVKRWKKTLLFDELGVSSFDVLVQNIILISPQQDTSHYWVRRFQAATGFIAFHSLLESAEGGERRVCLLGDHVIP